MILLVNDLTRLLKKIASQRFLQWKIYWFRWRCVLV